MKYQDYPSSFLVILSISVHDLGSMGRTLLNLAVNSQTKKRCYLANRKWSYVNQQGELNFTPIQKLAFTEILILLKFFLKNGAKTNTKNEFGYDALCNGRIS